MNEYLSLYRSFRGPINSFNDSAFNFNVVPHWSICRQRDNDVIRYGEQSLVYDGVPSYEGGVSG
jgi:hypothetical protein